MQSKGNETMGLVPNHEFIRINTKSPEFFFMIELPYIHNGDGLLKTGFLACRPRWVGQPSLPHVDMGLRTACPMRKPYLDF